MLHFKRKLKCQEHHSPLLFMKNILRKEFGFSFEKIFTAQVQTLMCETVVGFQFATPYPLIDNKFLTHTWGWLIFSFRKLLKFKMMHFACLFLYRWNADLQTFEQFTKHYLFGQFMASKTNSWYLETVFYLCFGVA